jgi:glucokinase
MNGELIYGGVDVGGTNIAVAIADRDGNLVSEASVPTMAYQGPDSVLHRMGELVLDLAEKQGGTLHALGVGLPGLIDLQRGATLFMPNFPTNWRNVPARALLERQVSCPVALLNDARIARSSDDFARLAALWLRESRLPGNTREWAGSDR